jgi:hypothetical protein
MDSISASSRGVAWSLEELALSPAMYIPCLIHITGTIKFLDCNPRREVTAEDEDGLLPEFRMERDGEALRTFLGAYTPEKVVMLFRITES